MYSDTFVKIAQADFTSTQSHILSLFERSRTAQSFLDDNRNYLFADDDPCPTCPPSRRTGTYLFYQLKDPTKDLAKAERSGFAGVLLNERFVSDNLIARTIMAITASHSPATAITISDENQRVLYSNAAAQNSYLLESNFDPRSRIGKQ